MRQKVDQSILKRKWRQEIVPEGSSAAWTHFNAQISAWAGRRYLETGSDFYLNRATETFNRTIAMITGEGEYHILLDGRGEYQVKPVTSGRLPECISIIITKDGSVITTPSPNTQLDWAVEETVEATAVLGAAIWKKAHYSRAAGMALR